MQSIRLPQNLVSNNKLLWVNKLTPIPPKTIGFLKFSGGIEVNYFVQIHLVLEVEFRSNP